MIYVDDLTPKSDPRWSFDSACNMRADTLAQLYAFADLLRLRRAWIKDGDRFELSPPARRRAVLLGAIEVGAEDMAELRRVWRARAGDR